MRQSAEANWRELFYSIHEVDTTIFLLWVNTIMTLLPFVCLFCLFLEAFGCLFGPHFLSVLSSFKGNFSHFYLVSSDKIQTLGVHICPPKILHNVSKFTPIVII